MALVTVNVTLVRPSGLGIRIQPTFAIVREVRVDESRDMNCPMPPAH